jgi:hypothetical protein
MLKDPGQQQVQVMGHPAGADGQSRQNGRDL